MEQWGKNIFNRILLGRSNLNSTSKIIGKHPNGLCEFMLIFIECRKYEQERGEIIE